MSYLNKFKWEILPKNFPIVRRNCTKCGKKKEFVNTKKFRVNANGNYIDVWLIFQCNKCKSTWNLAIYERVRPEEIKKEEYNKFLSNSIELVRHYAFNMDIYSMNKAETVLESIDYDVNSKESTDLCQKENAKEIEIICKYPIRIRMEKLLAEQLKLSRSQVKRMCQVGNIYTLDNQNLIKIKDGTKIYLDNYL